MGVQELYEDQILLDDLVSQLKRVYDLERLIARISYGTANARDLISLKQSVSNLPEIKKLLASCRSNILNDAGSNLDHSGRFI